MLRSLGRVAGAVFDKRKPEDLPTPFGKTQGQGSQSLRGIVLNWNERAAFAGRTLAASAEDQEPVFQLAVTVPKDPQEPRRPDLVLVVRMGGDRKAIEVGVLIDRLKLSFTSQLTHDITQLACAFVFDADTPGHYKQMSGDCVQFREQRFAADYVKELAGAASPQHATWTTALPFPLGLFVLHAGATRSGTLEHLVEPALQADPVWAPRMQAVEQILLAHEQPTDPVFDKDSADRAKARLTMAGQWRDPGSSLAQILRRGDPKSPPSVPDAVFASPDASALVQFLMSAPW
ncbi:MAG: hypothetical protein ABJE95_03865 [Byssovorax sp.]